MWGCTVRLSYKPALKGVNIILIKHCKNLSIKSNDRLRWGQVLPFLKKCLKVHWGREWRGFISKNSGRENNNIPLQHTLPLHNLTAKQVKITNKTYSPMTAFVSNRFPSFERTGVGNISKHSVVWCYGEMSTRAYTQSFIYHEEKQFIFLGFRWCLMSEMRNKLQNSKVWSYLYQAKVQVFTVIFPLGVAASRSPEKIVQIREIIEGNVTWNVRLFVMLKATYKAWNFTFFYNPLFNLTFIM